MSKPLKNFKDSLEAVYLLVAYYQDTVSIRNKSGSILGYVASDSELRELFEGFKAPDDHSIVLNNSLLVVSFGLFEVFVSELIESFVDEINKKFRSIDDLPDKKVFNQNVKLSAKALHYAVDGNKIRSFDEKELIEGLYNTFSDQEGLSFSGSAMSYTEGKFSLNDLNAYLSRLGFDLEESWMEVGKCNSLQKLLKCRNETSCAREAKEYLGKIISDRHSVAHGKGVTLNPIVDIKDRINFLELFSKKLENLVRAKLNLIQ